MSRFNNFQGPFSIGIDLTDSIGDVIVASGAGTIDALQVDQAGNVTGAVILTGSMTIIITPYGGTPFQTDLPYALTDSWDANGLTLHDLFGDVIPLSMQPTFSFSFAEENGTTVLRVDGADTIIDLDLGIGIIFSGSANFHAVLEGPPSIANELFTANSEGDFVGYGGIAAANTATDYFL